MYQARSYTATSWRIFASCVCVLFMVAPGTAVGQAWTLPKGESYVKLFYGKVTSAEQFTFDGRHVDFIDGLSGDTYRDRSLYVYSEVGIGDNVSLIMSFPYKRTFVRDHAFRFRLFAPGTAMLGTRLSLLPLLKQDRSNQALSINLYAYIPTGYVRNYTPSSGAGQVDVQASLFYGYSFHPFPAYAQAGAGYKYRSSFYGFSKAISCIPGSDIHCIADQQPDYGDEWTFHIEAGVAPLGKLALLQVLGLGTWSIQNPTVGFSPLNPIPTEQRYIKVGAGLTVYPFTLIRLPVFSSLGINAQYFETPFGRNTISSRDLFVGFEFRSTLLWL